MWYFTVTYQLHAERQALKEKSETNLPIESVSSNFIRNIIDEDNRTGKWSGRGNTIPARTQWLLAYWSR